ncbi:SRPBCC family protein [Reichenbachiella faecimaris]|nr:SRPBCC domain-containing protein [Reichenbachiella faecimaris]
MDITHKLQINATARTIKDAVATQTGITGWWSKDCQVGESEGENSLLKFDKQGTIVEMGFKTISVTASQVIWECTTNANPAWIGTKIITDIASKDSGSEVVFSHAGFDDNWARQEPFEMTKQGWEHFVNSLVSYCETGSGQPW